MLACRLRHLAVQMPATPDGRHSEPKCFPVLTATAQNGCFTVLRKSKALEVALAEAAAAGCNVQCRFTPEEAAAMDENDWALYQCVTLPHNVDELLLTISRMQRGGTRIWQEGNVRKQQQFYRRKNLSAVYAIWMASCGYGMPFHMLLAHSCTCHWLAGHSGSIARV
jgi:hypothetical protein